MANIGDYIVRGIATATIKDYKTKKPTDILKNCTSFNLDNTADVIKKKGGAGNKVLISWESNKESKLSFSVATQSLNILAMQNGTTKKDATGSTEVEYAEVHKIENDKITLDKTLVESSEAVLVDGVKFSKATADDPSEKEYKIESGVITFKAGLTGTASVAFKTSVTGVESVERREENESASVAVSCVLLLQSVATKDAYLGILDCPSGMLSSNSSIVAKQEGEPDDVTLEIDLSAEPGNYTWNLQVLAN